MYTAAVIGVGGGIEGNWRVSGSVSGSSERERRSKKEQPAERPQEYSGLQEALDRQLGLRNGNTDSRGIGVGPRNVRDKLGGVRKSKSTSS